MFKRFKLLKDQRGLTLIELLVVVVILGIIGAIAVPSIGGLMDNSKKDAHVGNAQQMVNATKLYVTGLQALPPDNKITLKMLIDNGFIDPFSDPDTGAIANNDTGGDDDNKGYFNSASFVEIVEVGNVVTYEVYLKGAERSIGTDTTPVSQAELDRSKVQDNS